MRYYYKTSAAGPQDFIGVSCPHTTMKRRLLLKYCAKDFYDKGNTCKDLWPLRINVYEERSDNRLVASGEAHVGVQVELID